MSETSKLTGARVVRCTCTCLHPTDAHVAHANLVPPSAPSPAITRTVTHAGAQGCFRHSLHSGPFARSLARPPLCVPRFCLPVRGRSVARVHAQAEKDADLRASLEAQMAEADADIHLARLRLIAAVTSSVSYMLPLLNTQFLLRRGTPGGVCHFF